MAKEQITASQIVGGVGGGGAQQQTLHISLAGGTTDKATANFSFVVGLVFVEIMFTDTADADDVHTYFWANMRSFGGTKTADVTDRRVKGNGSGSGSYFDCSRTSAGTIITIKRPFEGTDVSIDGTGIASYTGKSWPNPGRIRVTAIEDMQS